MLEKFVSDNKIISEYKDKMLINRNMILRELNNNEMYYIYDKKGILISTQQTGTDKEFKQEFSENIFISNEYLGEKAIVEGEAIRSMTRLDRINEKLEELQDGECIKDNEIIMVEKPNNFHFWDTNL